MQIDLSELGIEAAEPAQQRAQPRSAMPSSELAELRARVAQLEATVRSLQANDQAITNHVNGLDAKIGQIAAVLVKAAGKGPPQTRSMAVRPAEATAASTETEVDAELVDPSEPDGEDRAGAEDAAFYGELHEDEEEG